MVKDTIVQRKFTESMYVVDFPLKQKHVMSKQCFHQLTTLLISFYKISNNSFGHSEQEYCKLHHSCETNATYLASCGHPPHFKHPHEECYAGYPNNYNDYLKDLNLLSCLNRMDKKDSMFTQNIFQRRTPAKKLSTLLNYTEDYFVCRNTTYDWTIATFENIVNV